MRWHILLVYLCWLGMDLSVFVNVNLHIRSTVLGTAHLGGLTFKRPNFFFLFLPVLASNLITGTGKGRDLIRRSARNENKAPRATPVLLLLFWKRKKILKILKINDPLNEFNIFFCLK